MIREKLCKYFLDREFNRVDLHHEQTDLFYIGDGTSAQLVWILSEEFYKTLNKESYLHYYNKLTGTFINRGFVHVNMLALVINSNPKEVQTVASGTPFWVVDEVYGRVVIYDNQPEDFLGIRKPVESMVSMLSADQMREEVFYARPGQNGYTDSTANTVSQTTFKPRKVVEFKPYIVLGLIVINFVLLLITDMFGVDSIITYGANSWTKEFMKGEWYRLLTSIFLHGSIDHFIGNMIILFAAGSLLERILGHKWFVVFYLLGGLGASLGSSIYYRSIEKGTFEALLGGTTSIGASGAIYAVVFGLIFYFITHRRALYMLGANRIALFILYLGYTIYSGMVSTGIDNAAHISGAVVGGLIYLIFNCIGKGDSGNV